MTALWHLAAQSPIHTRILFWTGLVVAYVLTTPLPYILGTLIRIVLMGVLFAIIAMALSRGRGRIVRVLTWTILGSVLFLAGIAALFR